MVVRYLNCWWCMFSCPLSFSAWCQRFAGTRRAEPRKRELNFTEDKKRAWNFQLRGTPPCRVPRCYRQLYFLRLALSSAPSFYPLCLAFILCAWPISFAPGLYPLRMAFILCAWLLSSAPSFYPLRLGSILCKPKLSCETKVSSVTLKYLSWHLFSASRSCHVKRKYHRLPYNI